MKKHMFFIEATLAFGLLLGACGGDNGANGVNGATGPAGPGVTWVNVTDTLVQAESNTGYMANNSSQVTITLPASLAVGDVVQVSGVGSGGWKIAQNAGQSIITKDIIGNIGAFWIPRESNRNWQSVELQYIGSNAFTVLSHEGYLNVQ